MGLRKHPVCVRQLQVLSSSILTLPANGSNCPGLAFCDHQRTCVSHDEFRFGSLLGGLLSKNALSTPKKSIVLFCSGVPLTGPVNCRLDQLVIQFNSQTSVPIIQSSNLAIRLTESWIDLLLNSSLHSSGNLDENIRTRPISRQP
jgi:hypothetical protein